MKITCDHPASSYGQPVILDDEGNVLDYPEGIVAVRNRLGLTQGRLAEACNVGLAAVRNYEQGRRTNVPASLLNMLAILLDRPRADPPRRGKVR